jgi:hypothetical protein
MHHPEGYQHSVHSHSDVAISVAVAVQTANDVMSDYAQKDMHNMQEQHFKFAAIMCTMCTHTALYTDSDRSSTITVTEYTSHQHLC